MFRMRVEEGSIIRNHEAMAKELMTQIAASAERSKDILVASIREDLARKILRPRESDGGLSDAIDGEIIRREGNILIGIGNIDRMSKEAPHWRLQERGGPISVRAVPGYFVDASGQRITTGPGGSSFDKGRAPTSSPELRGGFVRRKVSNDLFIYDGGKSGSIMFVRGDVKPKKYFEAGELRARQKVLDEFEKALRRTFR